MVIAKQTKRVDTSHHLRSGKEIYNGEEAKMGEILMRWKERKRHGKETDHE